MDCGYVVSVVTNNVFVLTGPTGRVESNCTIVSPHQPTHIILSLTYANNGMLLCY